MKIAVLSFVIGVLASGFTPILPSLFWLLSAVALLLFFALLLSLSGLRGLSWLVWLLAGVLWGWLYGHWQLAHRLPPERAEETLVVQGEIGGLPDADMRRQRVMLKVQGVETLAGEPLELRLRRLQINWYGDGPPLMSGERWQFKVRLRPPRGFVNPSAFDYQLWLMRQKVDATGYVLAGEENTRLAPATGFSPGYWRQRAQTWLLGQPELRHVEYLQALLIGDRSGLDGAQWQRLQRTGTNHLIAISGLHVGFVAVLGFTLGSGLGRLLNLVCHRLPASLAGHLFALLLALGYSALAGFALPTQRALVMVLAVQVYLIGRRKLQAANALVLALGVVVLVDPLAGFDIGFWLSFAAVAVLFMAFVGRRSAKERLPGYSLVRAQWAIFLGLLIPLALLIDHATLLAPLANLVAIPLVTFGVVPWLLLSAALAGLWPPLSQGLLVLADWGLEGLNFWLTALDSTFGDSLQLSPALSWPSVLLAVLAVLMLLMPKGLPGRALAYPALILVVFLPGPAPPPLRVTFLDVGQGLAMVVQTSGHSLVYDTGPRYSDRMEAGGAIIAPYLSYRGIDRLDAVVVSHRHSDHSGGLPGLLDAVPTDELWLGEPLENLSLEQEGKNCHTRHQWEWDHVQFQFLFAGLPANPNSNNHSCVLLIQYADQSILLTGDIEREVEWRLVGSQQAPEAVQLLQIPHHGSETSSTQEWVARVRPQIAIASAGYRGRYGHPTETIVQRYEALGSRVFNTAEWGAMEFEWDIEGQMTERYYRLHQKRYWFD